jgi:hypothetical protein
MHWKEDVGLLLAQLIGLLAIHLDKSLTKKTTGWSVNFFEI